jgi:hypothetical protein
MRSGLWTLYGLLVSILLSVHAWGAQASPTLQPIPSKAVFIRVIDENGISVPDAMVAILQGENAIVQQLYTDYLGRCHFVSTLSVPYGARVEKPGFYMLSVKGLDPQTTNFEFVLMPQQQIREEINVSGSPPMIDPAQVADASRMQAEEIVNVPYPTSRDIRNLLPFNPGVVRDTTAQVHVAGSKTYQTQDLLDGFNITSPSSGTLSLRFSADAVRSIDVESTRYPAEYGKATGGIIDFRSGMGDDRFRFNASNFIPSVQNKEGLTFDKFVPRFTFAGPMKHGKAWFYDGVELEYDNIVIPELPHGADSNKLFRGSNLAKFQVNLSPANNLTFGAAGNFYHSPFEGISPLTPQDATTKRNTTAWFYYIKDQHTFKNGTVLETGVANIRFHDSYAPHGSSQFQITPEGSNGSYFESLTDRSRRTQETADLYISPQQWVGSHTVKAGVDLDQITFGQQAHRKSIDYLREDKTLSRRSTFTQAPDFSGDNLEVGAYVQDQWSPTDRLLVQPGLRFDWDKIVRRPLFSPRAAFTYMLSNSGNTKLSGGVGVYYDHTQLEYIERAMQGPRTDVYYGPDGVTPLRAVETTFTYQPSSLRDPRTVNWSVGLEQKLPAAIYLRTNFIQKRGTDVFSYLNIDPANALRSIYVLTNSRKDHYNGFEISARRAFAHGYTLFGSYVRSSATTNQVLEYYPTLSILGPQGGGPLPWDTPNRVISWGWLPVPKSKRFDFVYTMEWRSGFAFNAIHANQEIAGLPDAHRFPDYFSFSPGLEVRFHVHKTYLGLRGVLENVTNHQNPSTVNNVVDSPNYLTFSTFQGRAFTTRIRIIGSN